MKKLPSIHQTHKESNIIRDSNIELYRILLMFFIICHHYVVNSGVYEDVLQEPFGFQKSFILIWGMWGKVGINCFVMITGYYMCKSKISLKKFLKLFLQVAFYYIIINSIFAITGYHDYTLLQFITNILPVTEVTTSFTGAFLLFYLSIPFLNVLINNINRRQHILLIALCLLIYSVLGVIFGVSMNYVSWFCVIYFIASFIRLYGLYKNNNNCFWGLMSLASITITVLVSILFDYLFNRGQFFLVVDCNKIPGLFIAVSSFMFFKNLKLPTLKTINTISACTFGVFVIHTCGDSMRQWLWHDVFNNVFWYHTRYAFLHILIVPVLIFAIGFIIDKMRIEFIEKPILESIVNKIDRALSKIQRGIISREDNE